MQTYLSDLIPKIQRFSKKLDDQVLLINKHWVVIDELSSSKNVYIFRPNGQLIISQNGKVEKAKWEYLDHMSILIDRSTESYLFKHGFLDENILALKVDGRNEYAFMVNENKAGKEINTMTDLVSFLELEYGPGSPLIISGDQGHASISASTAGGSYPNTTTLPTRQGTLQIKTTLTVGYDVGDLVFLNGEPAPDGDYVYGWPSWASKIVVRSGRIMSI